MHSEAQVGSTRAERDVRIGIASDVEHIGVGEHVLVAIGRAVEHHDTVTLLDLLTADLHVVHHRALEVRHRTREAQHLLDGGAQQTVDIVHQALALFGMFEEQLHTSGQQVARGVATRVHEQQEEPLELGVGEAITIDLGVHENCGQIVAGVAPFVVGDRLRVPQHLADRRHLHLGRGDGVVVGVHDLGEVVETLAIGARHAHQLGDETRRKSSSDLAHEIATALGDHRVDDLAREFFDARPQKRCVLGSEATAHEQLEAIVLRRIHVEHHLATRVQVGLVGIGQHHTLLPRTEQLGRATDELHVLVLGDGPEARAAGRIFTVPEHGRVGAQPRVLLPRMSARGERFG